MMAAPSPWKARAPISGPSPQESPETSEAVVKRHDSGQEHPASSEQVSGASSEQEKAAEEQRVGADHPLKIFLGEAQVDLNRGQRHVHDRDVEHDHELHEQKQRQPVPLASS